MKTIENKKVVINVQISSEGNLSTVAVPQSYAELIFSACKRPSRPDQGYSYDELKSIGKIDDVTTKGLKAEILEFEDSDFDFVKERVKTMSWNIYDKELINFVTYIIELS